MRRGRLLGRRGRGSLIGDHHRCPGVEHDGSVDDLVVDHEYVDHEYVDHDDHGPTDHDDPRRSCARPTARRRWLAWR